MPSCPQVWGYISAMALRWELLPLGLAEGNRKMTQSSTCQSSRTGQAEREGGAVGAECAEACLYKTV